MFKQLLMLLRAIFLIAFFIVLSTVFASSSGLIDEISKLFYYPPTGLVAGEYTVRIAQVGGTIFNPPYPRVGHLSPTDNSYFTGCADLYAKFDFVGLSRGNWNCAKAIKAANPQVMTFGTFGSNMALPDDQSKDDTGNPATDTYKSTLKYLAFRSNNYRLAQDVAPNPASSIDIQLTDVQGLVPAGTNGRAIIVTGPNKFADVNQVLNYPALDRFSYTSINPANNVNVLVGVSAGHVDFTYHAGDYVLQPAKDGGWIVNVSTRNPHYQDVINYFVDYKYSNVPTAVLDQFDGIWYDLFRIQGTEPEFTNVDFNFDYSPDTDTEKSSSWQAGLKEAFAKEKQRTGKNYIITNDGFGVIPPSSVASWHDGFILEEGMYYINSWKEYYDTLNLWGSIGNKFIISPDGKHDSSWWTAEKKASYKNKFNDMRYGLTTNAMGPAFYSKTVGPYYMMNLWYDEYQTDLGYPLGAPQEITSLCFTETLNSTDFRRCPYIRFFDKGAAIVNATFRPDTKIKKSDISGLPGYGGRSYYRFYGGQDPLMNNGHELTDADPVILYGAYMNNPGKEGLNKGDGVLLFNQPDYYVVADIVVGNYNNNDTSPGSQPVETAGSWSQGIDTTTQTNPYYSQWNDDNNAADEGFGYFYTTDSSATATFRPTIGLAGEYEVYEWHGWHGSSGGNDEASNVPYEIVSNGSVVGSGTIDQKNNYGQWNKLGDKFVFPAVTNNYVKIAASGATGVVIADAVKFVFTGNTNVTPPPPPPACIINGTCEPGETNANCPDDCPCDNDGTCEPPKETTANCPNDCQAPVPQSCFIRPDFNCDGKVDVKDFGILLSHWEKTDPPARLQHYLHSNCAGTEKNLNLDCQTLPTISINEGDFSALFGCWGAPDQALQPGCFVDNECHLCSNNPNPNPNPNPLPLIYDINQPSYKLACLQVGDEYYVDRNQYTITGIPASLENSLWLMTANDDKYSPGDSYLTFMASAPVTVYVAFDSRINPVPTWLVTWQRTGDSIGVTDLPLLLNIYRKDFPAGQIVLGGAQCSSYTCSMYAVLIRAQDPTLTGCPLAGGGTNGFFVATTGSDDPGVNGDINHPWQTIQYAFNRSEVSAGDIINIRAGTYNESVDSNTKSGQTGQLITLRNYQSEAVIITGNGVDNTPCLDFQDSSYLKIYGLKISNCGNNGVWLGDYSVADSLEVFGVGKVSRGRGIVTENAQSAQILNSHIHDNQGVSGSDGIFLWNSDNVLVRGNNIHDNSDDGIDGLEGVVGATIENNIIYNNSNDALKLGQFGSGAGHGPGNESQNNIVRNNLTYNNSNGMTITGFNNQVYNNTLSSGARSNTFVLSGRGNSVKNNIINASFWMRNGNAPPHGPPPGEPPQTHNEGSMTIENNLLFSGSITTQINTYGSFLLMCSATTQGCNSQDANPLFVNKAGADFHLQATSPAIDRGTTVPVNYDLENNARPMPVDGGYDLGAYEHP